MIVQTIRPLGFVTGEVQSRMSPRGEKIRSIKTTNHFRWYQATLTATRSSLS